MVDQKRLTMLVGPGSSAGSDQSQDQCSKASSGRHIGRSCHHLNRPPRPPTTTSPSPSSPPPTAWWWTLGCKTRRRRPPGRSRPQTGSPGAAGGHWGRRRSYIDSASPPPPPPPSPPPPAPPAITTNLCMPQCEALYCVLEAKGNSAGQQNCDSWRQNCTNTNFSDWMCATVTSLATRGEYLSQKIVYLPISYYMGHSETVLSCWTIKSKNCLSDAFHMFQYCTSEVNNSETVYQM